MVEWWYTYATMGLNIKNADVERLADEIARQTGETKTEAIRKALEERKARLLAPARGVSARRLRSFLERDVWPLVPEHMRGKRLTRAEEDSILGYGPDGV